MLSSKIASQEGNCEHLIGSDPSHDQINQSDEGIPIKSVAEKFAVIFIVIGISSMEGSQTSK